jgi:acylphosphatase
MPPGRNAARAALQNCRVAGLQKVKEGSPCPLSILQSCNPAILQLFLYYCVRVIVARRYLISGRVQGVGFRYFTEATARREGILGWVRNTPDGRVEVAAEGDAEALERFERSLRHGPPGARVERVDVDDTSPTGRESGFTIK